MRVASQPFAQVVTGSHLSAARVDVLFDRQVIAEGLAVVAGQITYDRNAARLARATVTIADPLRVPVAADDILTPFGYELLVWRGVTLPSGPELVPLGVFPIQVSSVDGVTLLSSITAEDRSRLVSDAGFEDDYQIPAGTNLGTAIQEMISDAVPGVEFLYPSVPFETPLLTFAAGDDRWEKAQRMARDAGYEVLFDGLGRNVLRAEPTFSATPVAAISEGVNMTGANVALDRSTAYNRVIATGRNASTGEVYTGVATDDDPGSPTYYYGPFGKKPRRFFSEFLGSDAQAESAARAILSANLGVSRSVDFAAVPDPRLECSDVVQITRSALGVDDLHIIDQLTIGLGADATMTGQSRTQQVAA